MQGDGGREQKPPRIATPPGDAARPTHGPQETVRVGGAVNVESREAGLQALEPRAKGVEPRFKPLARRLPERRDKSHVNGKA